MALGDRIKELRQMRNMTQEEIAESCNVSTSTVSRWEGNRSTPIQKHILMLASALQVDENSFFVTPDVTLPENIIIEEVIQVMKQMPIEEQRFLLHMAQRLLELVDGKKDCLLVDDHK